MSNVISLFDSVEINEEILESLREVLAEANPENCNGMAVIISLKDGKFATGYTAINNATMLGGLELLKTRIIDDTFAGSDDD